MRIALDHLSVPVRDRRAAARQLADILGVAWSETGVGPFCPVYVNDSLTLDFDQHEGDIPVLHFAFHVDDATFDAIVSRLREHGIPYKGTPRGAFDNQVNTAYGGRMVYWMQPDGHMWEALTASYARQPA